MTSPTPRDGGLPFDPIDEAARQAGVRRGRGRADARGHLADAGATARARPARRAAQAARADLRPLRGAGAAHLLLARVAAARQDGRAPPGAPHVGHLDRRPARRLPGSSYDAGTRSTGGLSSPRSPSAGGPSVEQADRRRSSAQTSASVSSTTEGLRALSELLRAGAPVAPATSEPGPGCSNMSFAFRGRMVQPVVGPGETKGDHCGQRRDQYGNAREEDGRQASRPRRP